MSEKLIELLMSWGIPERTATSQIEYLVGSTIPFAIWETVYTTVLATIFAYVIGLPLGIILVTGEREGIRPLSPVLMEGSQHRREPSPQCALPDPDGLRQAYFPADSGDLHRDGSLHCSSDFGSGPLCGPGGGELPSRNGPRRHRGGSVYGVLPLGDRHQGDAA